MATREESTARAEMFLSHFRNGSVKPFSVQELEILDYDHPDWERNELNRSYLREVVRQTCERAMQSAVSGWTDTDYEIMREHITHEIAKLYGDPGFFVPPVYQD